MVVEGSVPGGVSLERRLHWENADKRQHGEWFKMTRGDVYMAIGGCVGHEECDSSFFDEVARVRAVTLDGFLSATELVRVGNRYRVKDEKPALSVSRWISRESTESLIDELTKRESKDPVSVVGHGVQSQTWVHPVLFMDLVFAIEPMFLCGVKEVGHF